jgi:hypothetical protein
MKRRGIVGTTNVIEASPETTAGKDDEEDITAK